MDFGRLLADPIMQHAVVLKKKSMLDFLSVWKTRRRYANSGPLLADHILHQMAASARILFVKCIFGRFLCFGVFKPEEGTWVSKHFSTPAEPSRGKASRLKSSWAESSGTDRPALYTLTPDRPPVAAYTGRVSVFKIVEILTRK